MCQRFLVVTKWKKFQSYGQQKEMTKITSISPVTYSKNNVVKKENVTAHPIRKDQNNNRQRILQ